MTNEELLAKIVGQHRLFYKAMTSASDMLKPMFLAVLPSDDILPILVDFSTAQEKAMLCDRMSVAFRGLGVKQYAFFSESWMASYKTIPDMTTTRTPSQREDRIEIIMTLVADADGNKVSRMLEMVRDMNTGLVIDLIDTDFIGTAVAGQFAELLD